VKTFSWSWVHRIKFVTRKTVASFWMLWLRTWNHFVFCFFNILFSLLQFEYLIICFFAFTVMVNIGNSQLCGIQLFYFALVSLFCPIVIVIKAESGTPKIKKKKERSHYEFDNFVFFTVERLTILHNLVLFFLFFLSGGVLADRLFNY
jgi:hypothetical protein